MRKTFALLFSLILVTLGCAGGRCVTPTSRAAVLDQETVGLIHQYHGETRVFCSGVWVTPSVILTAEHCVKGLAYRMSQERAIENGADPMAVAMGIAEFPKLDPEEISIPFIVKGELTGERSSPSGLHFTKVIAMGVDSDLALLEAINPKMLPEHVVAGLPSKTPEVGEKLFIVGHPGGLFWTHTEGNVAGYRGDMNDGEEVDPVLVGPFLQVDAAVWKGNSGGGAFNEDGELVGIASFMGEVPNCAFFVHLDNIKAIMKNAHLIKMDLDKK